MCLASGSLLAAGSSAIRVDQLSLAVLVMGQPEQIDHAAAAGLLARQVIGEAVPGQCVFGSWKETVAIDLSGQRLGLSAQSVDDMTIVDAVTTGPVIATAQAGMGDDMRDAEPGFDAIIIDMHPQALADELGRCGVEDAIRAIIASEADGAMEAHDLRTRHAGPAIFIDFHLVVPGETTVFQAHEICDRIESVLKEAFDDVRITIHVEPEHQSKQSSVIVLD